MYTGRDTATSRAERAYGELKERLLAGDFALGQRLGEERVAAMIGVSRTPVREALSRLHVEGFVERLPDGGYCPAAPNLHAIAELYEVRRGLELLALRRSPGGDDEGAAVDGAAVHDHASLEALREDWRTLDLARTGSDAAAGPDPSFVLLDEDFHVRLAESAGNRELAVLLQAINERIRLVRIYDFLTPERIDRTIRQHLGIVEAVLDGSVDDAEGRLLDHLTESLAVVEQRAATALARMITSRNQP